MTGVFAAHQAVVDRVTKVTRGSQETTVRERSDRLVLNSLLALDPSGPMRYRDLSFQLEGLPNLLGNVLVDAEGVELALAAAHEEAVDVGLDETGDQLAEPLAVEALVGPERRGDGGDDAVRSVHAYSFTPPWVSPAISCFWPKAKAISTGMLAITMIAATTSYGVPARDRVLAIASGNVA